MLNFDYLCHYLTNLTLKCFIKNKHFSFEFLQHQLIQLPNLKYLRIVLICQLDAIDGNK